MRDLYNYSYRLGEHEKQDYPFPVPKADPAQFDPDIIHFHTMTDKIDEEEQQEEEMTEMLHLY